MLSEDLTFEQRPEEAEEGTCEHLEGEDFWQRNHAQREGKERKESGSEEEAIIARGESWSEGKSGVNHSQYTFGS